MVGVWRAWWVAVWALVGLLATPAGAQVAEEEEVSGLTTHGLLTTASTRLSSGESADIVYASVRAGEFVTVTLTTHAFTPYLIVTPAEGQQIDQRGVLDQAVVTFIATIDGPLQVIVTTDAPGQGGSYHLAVRVGEYHGRLAKGATVLETGEYSRVLPVWVPAGDYLITLESTDFDPYLIVHANRTELNVADDLAGKSEMVSAAVHLSEPGQIAVQVTTQTKGQAGDYRLCIESRVPPLAVERVQSGTLGADDWVLGGAWADAYSLPLPAGQQLAVSLTGAGYQPIIEVYDGGGRRTESVTHERGASLTFTNSATGTVQFLIRGPGPNVGGGYVLTVSPVSLEALQPRPTPETPAEGEDSGAAE